VAKLTAEDGWLTLTGLFWLSDGTVATFGPGEANDLVLEASPGLADAPPTLGTLRVRGGSVILEPAVGTGLTAEGRPVHDSIELESNEPPSVHHDTLELSLIERGGNLALRVRDTASPARFDFTPIESWPYDPSWRVEARFEPYPEPREIPVPNVTPFEYPGISPGQVLFEHDGRPIRLDALGSADEPLFLIVGDTTNGETTYGGGRYLYTVGPPRPDGSVTVDFNRLYDPPCVFTAWATCPLPPRQNRLDFALEVGEKSWSGKP
jgi:uncharacterized protein (DUF1684 family)